MNVSRLMALFHFSFVAAGLLTLLMIAGEIVSADLLALWAIVIAVAINAFFGVLWLDEAGKKGLEKQRIVAEVRSTFPMISIVASAYNEEQTIPRFVKDLFDCAQNYRGPSEIILIDDGSIDNTYESAWAAIDSLRKEMPHIRAHVLKHMTHLGKTETARTGTNKAMGEYIALTNASTTFDTMQLNSMVDAALSAEKETSGLRARRATGEPPHLIRLYRADSLRRLLNEEQGRKAIDELNV